MDLYSLKTIFFLYLHLFTFQTPIFTTLKKIKKCKINIVGLVCLSIQQFVNFKIFIEEFASLVLNTIFFVFATHAVRTNQ